jgi:hypothetical protein
VGNSTDADYSSRFVEFQTRLAGVVLFGLQV